MRLGLIVHRTSDSAAGFARELAATARGMGMEVLVEPEGGSGPDEPVDVLVAVGGDGTVLDAVRHAMSHGVPVIGFNLGTIGFLTTAEPDHATQVLEALREGRYRTVERLTLHAEVPGVVEEGLNDAVVEKIDSQRIVELDLEVDGHHFTRYRADGVVVATPTGSTAYAFSAGGPLVDPRVQGLIVAPVASHSLFGRSVMVPADSVIRCTVVRDRPVQVSVDGRVIGVLGEGGVVEVRRGTSPVTFLEVEDVPFTAQVRRKFGLP